MSEIDVLKEIEKSELSTQRDIAKNTGLSLGMVNMLLKRLVKKGFVKMEHLTPRKIKYILTPSGIKRLTSVTYSYIVSSINYLNRLEAVINELVDGLKGQSILLYGKKDDVYDVLKTKLDQHGAEYILLKSMDELGKMLDERLNKDKVIVTWNPECREQLDDENIECLCILDKM